MGLVFLLLLVPYYCVVWSNLMIASVVEYLVRTALNQTHHPREQLTMTRLERLCRSRFDYIVGRDMHLAFETQKTLRNISLSTTSTRIRNSSLHTRYLADGQSKIAEIRMEIGACMKLMNRARQNRRIQANPIPGMDTSDLMKNYLGRIAECQTLKNHLSALETDMQHVEYLSQTEAAMDLTGYRGLVHWSKITLKAHEHLLNVLATISLVGSGLTYSSIFSTPRGNIGLMCLAFVLFNYGFAIPIVQQALLHWASRRPPTTRLSGNPKLWKLFVLILTYSTVAAVIAAVCILNLTLWDLHFTVGPHGEQRDAPLTFDNPPRPAAALTFIVMMCILFSVIVILVFHYSVNGWHTLVDAVLGRTDSDANDHDSRETLNGYVLV